MRNFICSLKMVAVANMGLIILSAMYILIIKMNEKEIADRIVGEIFSLKKSVRLFVLSIIVYFTSILINTIDWLAWILLITGIIIATTADYYTSNIKLSRQ